MDYFLRAILSDQFISIKIKKLKREYVNNRYTSFTLYFNLESIERQQERNRNVIMNFMRIKYRTRLYKSLSLPYSFEFIPRPSGINLILVRFKPKTHFYHISPSKEDLNPVFFKHFKNDSIK